MGLDGLVLEHLMLFSGNMIMEPSRSSSSPENSAWAGIEIIIGPLSGDYNQRIYTRLEPGEYFVLKEF